VRVPGISPRITILKLLIDDFDSLPTGVPKMADEPVAAAANPTFMGEDGVKTLVCVLGYLPLCV
jgi:hypothetical protein